MVNHLFHSLLNLISLLWYSYTCLKLFFAKSLILVAAPSILILLLSRNVFVCSSSTRLCTKETNCLLNANVIPVSYVEKSPDLRSFWPKKKNFLGSWTCLAPNRWTAKGVLAPALIEQVICTVPVS
jgi:hypothetical protein